MDPNSEIFEAVQSDNLGVIIELEKRGHKPNAVAASIYMCKPEIFEHFIDTVPTETIKNAIYYYVDIATEPEILEIVARFERDKK